ncbi:type ISP restriction/modification enzyme [Devosia albogilva]|uniref:site-specific DNA-methyltransferase (adenine-specific) n=1 Tax=Devosia albogilva TaxID=429726 RepID=A0ABW5QKK4_9HYPH
MTRPEALKEITDFPSLVAYLRDELEWEIPDDLPLDRLTYSYTADELGLKLDAQVEITQLRPILGRENAWGVFFVDFDKAELPVTLLRRILSSVSRRSRASANPADRALFDKNDLLFVSAFGKAEDRRLALAHFHQDPGTQTLPTLRVLTWDRRDTSRHMQTVAERLDRLRWPDGRELDLAWKARWTSAFVDRPRDAIRTAKEMAQALADCAKQIRVAIEEILPRERAGEPLTQLFEAVKATLNKGLDVPKFADTYAQTIAYGLLSTRIDQVQRWRAEKAETLNGDLPLPPITADALETAIPTNPFLSELLTSFMGAVGRDAGGSALDFDELGLGDLVDLLNTANMEAVLDDFDKDKQGDDPVIHFYEGFLAAYDKAMKVQRGVFYTPKPVVSFIVRSVDEVLRTEFGLLLGLADTTTWGEFVAADPGAQIPDRVKPDEPFVKILDPATGTGTFLVEVIDLIWRRMTEVAWKGKTAEEKRRLWNAYVAEHLLPRLYGYELMMAPYAVAHMKIGLKLADTGYDFSGVETEPDGRTRPMRARVFLTNALEPAQDLDMQLAFMNEALAHEARAANEAKARARFTVVVGNPPYSGDSGNPSKIGNKLTPIGQLVQRYFQVDGRPLGERNPKWLNNDYVKFIRIAEHHLSETGSGVLGYITSNSWLDSPTFRGMRESVIDSFEKLSIIDLHGNINKRERAPDGGPDDGVFEILEGTNITLAAMSTSLDREVRHLDVFGVWPHHPPSAGKKLWVETHTLVTAEARPIRPAAPSRLLTAASERADETYASFFSLKEVLPSSSVGIVTARDDLTIGFTDVEILARAERFRDMEPEQARVEFHLGKDARDWKVVLAQADLRGTGSLRASAIPIAYRPFDLRSTIYTGRVRGFICMPRPEITGQIIRQPGPLISYSRGTEVSGSWCHIFAFDVPITHHSVSLKEVNYAAPLWLHQLGTAARPNLAPAFTARLAKLTGLRFDDGSDAPAQGALPGTEPPPPPQGALALRRERGDLKTTFGARDVFDWIYAVLHSPAYRERYADFLKSDFARVPLPKDRDLLAALIPLGTRLVALHLLDADALPDLLADPKARFVSNGGEACLGRFNKEVRRDASGRVYLNDQNWFATVSQAAWEHWIGGYQPAQKWLKDRSETGSKDKLKPGRLLTDEDILHYRRMIVALEETGKVMAEIDRVIDQHGGWPDAFRGMIDRHGH